MTLGWFWYTLHHVHYQKYLNRYYITEVLENSILKWKRSVILSSFQLISVLWWFLINLVSFMHFLSYPRLVILPVFSHSTLSIDLLQPKYRNTSFIFSRFCISLTPSFWLHIEADSFKSAYNSFHIKQSHHFQNIFVVRALFT